MTGDGGWHRLAALPDIPEGVLHETTVGGEPIILVRRGDVVHAVSALCPHKFTPLAGGHLDGARLTCPMHAATFDLATGRPMAGQEWAGHLPVFPTRVREGALEVHVPQQ